MPGGKSLRGVSAKEKRQYVVKRVQEFGDLFAPVLKLKQKLPKAERDRTAKAN